MPAKKPLEVILGNNNSSHLTKAEIEERKANEIKAPSDNIQPPSYLPDDLKAKFNYLSQELVNIGIMSNLDCEALARFIVSESQYEKVTEKILKSKTIGPKYFQLLQVQEKLFRMCRAAAGDLGLTISSRCKLVIPKKQEDKKPNKFTKFM
ncbi:phage terminase small subunit P27 family [Rhodopseudomonas parapalustris]